MQKRISTIPFTDTPEQHEKLLAVIESLKNEKGAVMAALHKAQDIYGYLPIEVQKEIARGLDVSLEEVYGVSTFYSQFSLTPKGKYNISICLGTACYVKGADKVLDRLVAKLGIQPEECTPDGVFSLTACRCIGACGLAPVLINLILTWKNRKRLVPKVYLPLAALVLAGSIPGAFLLKNVDARAIKLVFGVVVAALGAEMFSRESSRKRARSSKIVLAIIGVTAGVLCGLFGVGALLAAYVSRVTEDGSSFKANISAVFIVDNTFRIVLYSVLGLLTLDTVKSALLLMPFGFCGLFLGMKCSSRMNESLAKKITSVLLVLSGISLILKNL